MKLLKYFNAEQLFFEEFKNSNPLKLINLFLLNFISYFLNLLFSVIYFDQNKTYKNMNEKKCPICLGDYEQNDQLERLYCGVSKKNN